MQLQIERSYYAFGNPAPAPNYYSVAIGTVSAQVLAVNSARAAVHFFNPSGVDVYLMPASIGNAVSGTGLWVVSGADQTIDLPGPGAWNAIAASSAALFIIEWTQSA